jgi:hypothetical protein
MLLMMRMTSAVEVLEKMCVGAIDTNSNIRRAILPLVWLAEENLVLKPF